MRNSGGVRSALRAGAAALALAVGAGVPVVLAPGVAHADTVRDYQRWYFDELRLGRAHQITKGEGVVVAVVDTGVDATHPDLRGQVLPGRGLSPDAAADGRRDPDAARGHGTAMAGIIAGRGGGDMHVLGIAPRAKILPVSTGTNRSGSLGALGIRWAVDHGADVVNLSLGGPVADETLKAAVRYALEKDVVLVAAAGNRTQGDRAVIAPANIPGVLAVSGYTKSGRVWTGGTSGPEVVLSAPVEKIIGPVPASADRSGYGLGTGTSDGTAIVSGVVALVRARYPDLDAANVVNRLIRTAEDRGVSGRDPQYGFGAVDPVRALTADVPPVTGNPLISGAATAAPDGDGAGDDGPAISFAVGDRKAALVQGGICLAVVALVVTLIVIGVRSSRRRPRAPGPPPVPPGARPYGPPPGPVAGPYGPPNPWHPGAPPSAPAPYGAPQPGTAWGAPPGHPVVPAPPHGHVPPPAAPGYPAPPSDAGNRP